MTVTDEMGRGIECGLVVVNLDEVRGKAGRRAVDEHDGHAPGVEPGVVVAGRGEQEPGDPPLHHAPDDVAFPLRITPGARNQHGPAVTGHLQLHRVDDLGEERVGDGLDDEPDRGVGSRAQRPSHLVWLEAQVVHCVPDALTGIRGDPRIVVEHARGGPQAHPGRVRDIEQPGGPAHAVACR